MKSYKFRLYPNTTLIERMCWTLEQCRWVYNYMLGELNKQEKIDRLKLQSYLPELKKYYPDLGLHDEHSKALQYEVQRLFSNLKSLSELKKNGKKIGRMRFKSKNRFKSFTYNQSGFEIIKTGNRLDKLHLSKIGDIPIRIHREIEGTIKQVTVKQCASGKWYASVMVEQEVVQKQPIKKMIGIDMNIENFLTDTDKRVFENPKYLKKSLKILKRRQRRLSKKKKGSNNRKKHIIRVARAYERIENQRNDFMHKLSRKYVDTYDLIAIEDLNIKEMIKSIENKDMVKKHKRYFRRAIHDVSWNKFAQMLSYKAEGAGKTIERVDPFGTTKTSDKYKHYISSINILNKAIKKIGQGLSEFTPVDTEPLLKFISASSVVEAGSYFQNLGFCQWQFTVIKRYGYRKARVKPKFIFPREIFKEIEENLIKQCGCIKDNHVLFLVESKAEGHISERIALFFHDCGVMIGKEDDIILKTE